MALVPFGAGHEAELIESIAQQGTEKIQWIVLKSFVPREAHWDPEAYLNMCDLKLLIISGELNIRRNLICFPRGLKVLQWDKYNLDSLPIGVQFDELVDFKMQHSKIKQLWIETQHCRKPLEDHIKFIIPGSEIPSWFHNQNDLRCLFPKHWKIALSLEDIPYYCRSSEWWGIAICVVVHGDSTIVPKLSHDYLNLSASLPQHANSIVTLNFNLGEQYYSSDRLVILYAPCSHEIARSVEFGLGIYTSLVGAQDFSHEFEITKSGWRALCKEDIEAWRRAPKQNSNHGLFDLNVRPSVGDSEHATLLPPSPSSRSRAGRKRKTMFNFL
ncbi:TMV resistance protein N-like [Senna tora]|uniref:TMV resistance protein N-like n=1 Tax=Senna tora TaxID=362788 RepID=A0A834SSS7_9FABA|nr:TMV resistance protein N-like [Senna tora]